MAKHLFLKEKLSNWEPLMFLIFRRLGIIWSGMPTLSFLHYCHLLLQHEDLISENLVFIIWWGPFCSLAHSAIRHRGPCCQPAQQHVFPMLAKSVDSTVISVRNWRNSAREMKGRSCFVFLPIIGKKRKEKKKTSTREIYLCNSDVLVRLCYYSLCTTPQSWWHYFLHLQEFEWQVAGISSLQKPNSSAMGCTITSVS